MNSFGTSFRAQISSELRNIPGVGTYDVSSKISSGPSYSLKGNKDFRNFVMDIPGKKLNKY